MNKFVKKASKLQKQLRKKMGMAITGAFVFVIALTWNDFIKESVDALAEALGLTNQTWLFSLGGAILITVIAVIFITYFSRWGEE